MEVVEVVSSLAAPLQQVAAAGSLEVEVVEVVSALAARLEQVVAAGSLQVEVVEVVSSPPLAAQVGGAFCRIHACPGPCANVGGPCSPCCCGTTKPAGGAFLGIGSGFTTRAVGGAFFSGFG